MNERSGGARSTNGTKQLSLRLLALLALPATVSACWSTVAEQDVLLVPLEGDVGCPTKETVPLGRRGGGDRCHPRTLVSVDEGPSRRVVVDASGEATTLCEYLATWEQDYDLNNSFCIGSGRPLVAGRLRVAKLVRGRALAI